MERKELNFGQPLHSLDRLDASKSAELSEDEKEKLRESISGIDKSHVLANIDRLLSRPDMEQAGGAVLSQSGFGENLLRGLLVDQNRMIDSQKVAAVINRVVESSVSAGETLTPEKKDVLATEILRVIHGAINS